MSEGGHLSNEEAANFCTELVNGGTESILLAHLSKENNYEELAYETVKLEVTMGDNPYKGEDIPMMVAKRDTISKIITL